MDCKGTGKRQEANYWKGRPASGLIVLSFIATSGSLKLTLIKDRMLP